MEVCYSGAYHPVCDDGWTRNDATVVCKYMGYSSPYYRKPVACFINLIISSLPQVLLLLEVESLVCQTMLPSFRT